VVDSADNLVDKKEPTKKLSYRTTKKHLLKCKETRKGTARRKGAISSKEK